MPETRVASVVEEVAARTSLDAESLLRLRTAVRNNVAERKALQARLSAIENENIGRDEKNVRLAAFNWILGRLDQAEAATRGLPVPVAYVIRGGLAIDRGRKDEAVDQLQKAAEALPQSARVAAELAEAFRVAGKTPDALKVVERAEKNGINDSNLWLQKGWAFEATGQIEAAVNCYDKALTLDPNNAQATFRMAYYLDLRGEDNKAMDLYKKVAGEGSAFVNAMINLALLYEDKDDFDSAIACLKEAIKADPANRRAALYLRDAVESLDMYYDEGQRKESDRLEAILRIPCNDFELSVRSRNCLAKMNVKTLGDMVKKTEAELLAYKNFGETSLREIKQLLESKGLRLGMHREDEQKRARAQRLRLGPENAVLAKPITDLELSVRSRKCMQRLNIETVGDLVEKTEADLLATKNFGQTSLNEVKAKLAELGLGLKSLD